MCIKDFRRKDSQNRKLFVMRILVIGDKKLLNIGCFCLKNRHLFAAALSSGSTLAASTEQNRMRASNSTYTCSTATAAASCRRSSKQQPAPNRQTCDLTCAPRHSLCKQPRHNENIAPSSSSLSYLPEKGSQRRRSRERGGEGARACSCSSSCSSRRKEQQRLQQRLQHRLL